MKAHEKWLNETLGDKGAGKFMLETADCTTIDDIVLTVSETAWRGALEWVKKEAISLDERGDANRTVINRELES